MLSRMLDRAVDRLVGSTTAHACLCLPHCIRRCIGPSLCDFGRALQERVTCVTCDCRERLASIGCC